MQKPRSARLEPGFPGSALGGIRTPNLLIRSQMLYPLSYERIGPGESSVPVHGTKIGIGPPGGALDDACESLHKVPLLLHAQRWAYGVPITRNAAATPHITTGLPVGGAVHTVTAMRERDR